MPNWVMNIVTFSGEQKVIDALLAAVKGNNEQLFDFNKIIPMPKDLDIEDMGNCLEPFEKLVEECGGYEKVTEQAKEVWIAKYEDKDSAERHFELGRKMYLNQQKYGYSTWYDWCIDNWGSKWNACNCELVDNNMVVFQTAWSPVKPIIEKLAELFPKVGIFYQYAEEQIGYYVGEEEYADGVLEYSNDFDEYSKEAYEKYADIWCCDLEAEGYVYDEELGTYVYREQDYE